MAISRSSSSSSVASLVNDLDPLLPKEDVDIRVAKGISD